MGVPVIGLFGVTRPEFILTGNASFSIAGKAPCAGERHRVLGKHQMSCNGDCMNSITIEQVIEQVKKITS
jgi:ADP-heptose:LPS heptosyltransferase